MKLSAFTVEDVSVGAVTRSLTDTLADWIDDPIVPFATTYTVSALFVVAD